MFESLNKNDDVFMTFVNRLLKAPTWRTTQTIVEQNENFLNDPVFFTFIDKHISDITNFEVQSKVSELRELLTNCHINGISKTFDAKINEVITREPARARRDLDLASMGVDTEKVVKLFTAIKNRNLNEFLKGERVLAKILSDKEAYDYLVNRYADLYRDIIG